MSKDKRYIRKDLENYLDYTGDKMSDRDRNAFEKELQKDPFASEALEGMSMIDPVDIASDMADLQLRLKRRINIRRRVMLYRIAAAVAILLIVSASLLTVFYQELGLFPGPVATTESPARSEEKTAATTEEAITVQQTAPEEHRAAAAQVKKDISARESTPRTEKTETVEKSYPESAGEKAKISLSVSDESAEKIPAEKNIEQVFTESETTEDAAALKEMMFARGEGVAEVTTGAGMITGVVTSSENDAPLPGVSISLKGTTVSTTTDWNGKFEIQAAGREQKVLIADFIGMYQQEVPVAENKVASIIMEPSPEALETVLISGYGNNILPENAESSKYYRTIDKTASNAYQPASPTEGLRQFRNYISVNIKFPENTELKRSVVVMEFVVNLSGRPEQFNVILSPGAAFSNEAIRLLLQGPSWAPAQKDGKYLPEETRIRIVFDRKN